MFNLVKVLILAVAAMVFTTPVAMADTFYKSMGDSFHYDEWPSPAPSLLIKQDSNDNVIGFLGVEGAGVFMSNRVSLSTAQFVSIDFSNFAAVGSESSFGLEISWFDGNDDWDNFGIYRAKTNEFEGFVVGYWDESEEAGTYGSDLPQDWGFGDAQALSSVTEGSLKMNYTGSYLELSYKELDDTQWTLLYTLNLSKISFGEGDEIAVGFTGEGANVDFANYSAAATPIPGAIWLLGSGMVGLVGLRRKMKA